MTLSQWHERLCANVIDIQNRFVQGIWPKMYNSRDRECRRTAAPVQKRLNEEMRSLCIRICDANDCSPSSSTGGCLRKTLSLGNSLLLLLSAILYFLSIGLRLGFLRVLYLSLIFLFPSTVIFIVVHFQIVEILNWSAGYWSSVLNLSLVFLIQLNRCFSTRPIYTSKCQAFWLSMYMFSWASASAHCLQSIF